MKKIGIITFHRAMNYGAVLQAYALQRALFNMNVECEIIDYRKNKIELDYSLFSLTKYKGLSFIQFIKELAKSLLLFRPRKIKNYKSFILKYLVVSNKRYDKKNINQANDSYDIFITGSDQVWNNVCTGLDKAYFLEFVNDGRKKFSYAASFGFQKLRDELVTEYKRLLGGFNCISVREESGVRIIQELLDRKAELSLDPTLLVDKNSWESISIKPKLDRYILVYCLVKSENLNVFAEQLSLKVNLPVVYIDVSMKYIFKKNRIVNAGPRELLGYFSNADFIITNSFHGLMFSINFNKKVFVEQQRGKNNYDTRLVNMVKLFHLENRDVMYRDNININDEIDYRTINQILDIERKKSLDYLQRVIE